MKYVKMLGLLAVAATALMAFASTASATLTSPPGTKYGGEIIATSTNFQLDGTVDVTCGHSEVKAKPSSAGATSGTVTSLTYTSCSRSVTVTSLGTFSLHSDGTTRSTGKRITIQTTILGFPVHCIYTTDNTIIDQITEGVTPPVTHVISSPLLTDETSGLCGEDAEMTGTYTITKPTTAIVID